MIKIDSLLLLLKQYNLKNNEMSNLIKENKNELITKSLSLEELLSDLNLEDNNYNQLIAKELLDLNLPLAKEYFNEIEKFLNNLNLAESDLDLQTGIKIAVLIKKLNLPLNLNFFELFKDYVDQDKSIDDSINQLLELINTLSASNFQKTEQQGQKGEKNITINEDLTPLLNEFRQELNLSNSEKNKVVDLLTNFLIANNLIPEKEKLEQLILILNNYSQNSSNSLLEISPKNFNNLFAIIFSLEDLNKNKSLTSILPKFEKIINSNQEILENLNKNLSENQLKKVSDRLLASERSDFFETEKIIEKITDSIIQPDNISLEEIKESINSFNLVDKNSTLIKFLFDLNENLTKNKKSNDATENLLKQLSTNKLINYNNDLITLFLPFFLEEKAKTAEIKINKEENNNQQQQSLKFSFIFASNQLGDIEIKIKLNQKKLSALFITNQKTTNQLIKNNLDKLKENLSNDFNLQFIDTKFIATKEDNENIKLTSIDFKI